MRITSSVPMIRRCLGPGHGWVYVQSARLEPRALVEALERGRLLLDSTGVELQVAGAPAHPRCTLAVKAQPSSRYRIQFIGRQGEC